MGGFEAKQGILKTTIIALLALSALLTDKGIVQAIEEKAQAPWKVHIELSYVTASGNTDTETLAGKLSVKKEEKVNRYFLKGSLLRAEDKGEETANKWILDGRWERILKEKLFGFLTANYLKDKFSGYDYRVNLGPGLGYSFMETKEHQLKGLMAFLYSHDKFSEGDKSKDSYVSGKAALNYIWKISENLLFQENADYQVSFEDKDRYFINSETGFKVKINGAVSLGVTYTVAYQHKPPSPDIKHTDKVFMTSLIVDF
jgi:putative salt-induced outer membrane protein